MPHAAPALSLVFGCNVAPVTGPATLRQLARDHPAQGEERGGTNVAAPRLSLQTPLRVARR